MPIDTLARSATSSFATLGDDARGAWAYPKTVVPGDLGEHTSDPLQLMLEPTNRTFDPTCSAVSRLLEPNAEPIGRVVAAGCRTTWIITTTDPSDVDGDHEDGQTEFRMNPSVTPAGMELYRRIASATPLFLFADDPVGDRVSDLTGDTAGDARARFTTRAANAYANAVRSVEGALPPFFDGTLPDSEWQNTPAHVAYFGLTSALILLGRLDEAKTVSEAHLMLWPERLIAEWLAFHGRLQPLGM
jgi:hypothetical protein